MLFMSPKTDSSLATRPSLLARLKDWSQQTAWREFDHGYAPLLRNVARKAGLTDAEADEVAQETLIAVAKKIGEFQHAGNRGSFRAWLYQQARWRIADQFRARKKSATGSAIHCVHGCQARESQNTSQEGLIDPEATGGSESEVDPVFGRIWDAEWTEYVHQLAIERVKGRVSARQFQLFELHVLQGLGVRDAAKAAGVTMAAVYMANSRVGRLLKREIKALKSQ